MLNDKIKKQLKNDLIRWSNKNPVDVIWRMEFKIPYGSEEHLNADIFDQHTWHEEKKIIDELRGRPVDGGVNNYQQSYKDNGLDDQAYEIYGNQYSDGVPVDMVSEVPMTQAEIEEAFDNMNLDDYRLDEHKQS